MRISSGFCSDNCEEEFNELEQYNESIITEYPRGNAE